MVVYTHKNLSLLSGDIESAFLRASSTEKIWSRSGPEFGDKEGSIVVLKIALYVMKTAARSFHEVLEDFLWRHGFIQTQSDQDMWYKKSYEYNGYDYIITHVDDFLISSIKPGKYTWKIEQEFTLRMVEPSP